MLIITRKIGERITIGDDITVDVIEIKGSQVKLGVKAPRSVSVHRQEIYQKIRMQNLEAATVRSPDFDRAVAIAAETLASGETK